MAEHELSTDNLESLSKKFVDQSFNGNVDQDFAWQVNAKMFDEFAKHGAGSGFGLSLDRQTVFAEKKFGDNSHSIEMMDAISLNPAVTANWSAAVTEANGTVLRAYEYQNAAGGTRESVVLPGHHHEEITFWSKPYCDPGAKFSSPVLGLPEVYEVSRINDKGIGERIFFGSLDNQHPGQVYRPGVLPACNVERSK
jgi:hypothetical protein